MSEPIQGVRLHRLGTFRVSLKPGTVTLPLLLAFFISIAAGCGGDSNSSVVTPVSADLPARDRDRTQDESNQPEGAPTIRTFPYDPFE